MISLMNPVHICLDISCLIQISPYWFSLSLIVYEDSFSPVFLLFFMLEDLSPKYMTLKMEFFNVVLSYDF